MKHYRIKKILTPYLLVAPAVIGILLFCIYPIFSLVKLSFYDVNMLNASKTKFVGLTNYSRMFAKDSFSKSMANTVIYSFVTNGSDGRNDRSTGSRKYACSSPILSPPFPSP